MIDTNNFEDYQISEADIDKVIAYLKIIDPENATPENAIAFLERYAKRFHEMGHVLSDDELKDLYDQFRNNEVDS
jgi:ABC-type nitrate/sulfonate/bicarbonate transport system substrate-binding protein